MPFLEITTTSLPPGVEGQTYTQALDAIGGLVRYSWSTVAGNLPDGLALDPNTGVISGMPTKHGDFGFTVRVTDSQSPPDRDEQVLSITISEQSASFSVSPGNLTFSARRSGDDPADQSFAITNKGTAPSDWEAEVVLCPEDSDWIAACPRNQFPESRWGRVPTMVAIRCGSHGSAT